MAGKKPPVPKYEGVHRKRDISPGPKTVHEGHVIEDDSTRELPAVRASRKKTPRGRKYAPTTYESRGRQTRRQAAGAVADASTQYANRAALRAAAGGKPSVTGKAASGAAAGLATGAAVGSVVPGVGTAVGAGVGAVVGGAGGAISGHKQKREWKRALHADTAGPRKIVVAEFIICMVIAAVSPMTKTDDSPARLIKQLTALMLLFFGLGLLTSAGRSAAKVAAAFGGVVTIALVVSKRDLLVKVAQIFNGSNAPARTTARIPSGS